MLKKHYLYIFLKEVIFLKNNEAKCLECQAQLNLGSDIQKGEVITCGECSSDLEVVSVKPLKLSLAPKVQEDWGQ